LPERTQDVDDESFGFLVMRRRVDLVWTLTAKEHGFASKAEACARMEPRLKNGAPREPIPSGTPARPALYDLGERTSSDVFKVLTYASHIPAAWTLQQLYLALHRPDRNWVSDCQTHNFHTRLWEAQLLASFREQGLLVTQPHESPDFRIENRFGEEAWVEAVTANPSVPYNHVNPPQSVPPTAQEEIFFAPRHCGSPKRFGTSSTAATINFRTSSASRS
jgi:hypothetical protein